MDVVTHDIELQRNTGWRRGFTIKDDDGNLIDLTDATFDMDIRYMAGDTGEPLLSANIIPDNLPEGYIEIELLGSAFEEIGSKNTNLRLTYDLIATQDGITVPLMKGEILVLPGVSDNAG